MSESEPSSIGAIDEIRRVLSRIPALAGRSLAGLAAAPLGGLTNRSYRLSLDGGAYVLRLAGAGTATYIDRTAEEHNARLSARLGLAPEIVHFDITNGTMLTRYAAGATALTAASLADPGLLRRAVETLRRLHRSGLAFRGRVDPFSKIDEYIGLARGRPAPAALLKLREEWTPARAALMAPAGTPAPCHIDPAPDNFLALPGRDRLLLIDWEYSAMGDPLWDLADLSVEAELDAEQDAAMLVAYSGDAPPAMQARLTLHKGALLLLAAAWGHLQLARGNPGADFGAFVERRLRQAGRVSDSLASALSG